MCENRRVRRTLSPTSSLPVALCTGLQAPASPHLHGVLTVALATRSAPAQAHATTPCQLVSQDLPVGAFPHTAWVVMCAVSDGPPLSFMHAAAHTPHGCGPMHDA
eukprot:361401-Chlamydomonas_euryale.AAC.3